jgi:hypothetical protein
MLKILVALYTTSVTFALNTELEAEADLFLDSEVDIDADAYLDFELYH